MVDWSLLACDVFCISSIGGNFFLNSGSRACGAGWPGGACSLCGTLGGGCFLGRTGLMLC